MVAIAACEFSLRIGRARDERFVVVAAGLPLVTVVSGARFETSDNAVRFAPCFSRFAEVGCRPTDLPVVDP